MKYFEKTLATFVWKHLQHSDKHLQYTSEKQMKHFEQTLATFVYSYCNMCNILIYFYNIYMQHLQHISKALKYMLATCASSCRGVFDQPRETMSKLATTFTWWCRGGGGAVHAMAAIGECGVGHGGGCPRWRGGVGRHCGGWPRGEAECGWRCAWWVHAQGDGWRGRVARRSLGWGHARGDGRGSDADWGEQMTARCREACDGRRSEIFLKEMKRHGEQAGTSRSV
jgi:hypothetical protein